MRWNRRAALAAIPVALSLYGSASADDDWKTWATGDRFRIAAGYFLPNLDTTIQVTGPEGNIGSRISFERNLGLDDNKATGVLAVDWRFFKRHRLKYSYFELNRSATSVDSSVTIIIGDNEFDVNLPIQSFFDISANELSYSYSVLFSERVDLFVGLGVSVQDIATGLQGTASFPEPGAILSERLDATSPLPTLNFGFRYAINDKWLIRSKLGWLAVEADLGGDEILKGQIINANVGIRWKAFKHVGFFGRYQLFDVDVDFREEREVWNVDYDYHGPLVGVDVRF